MRKGPTARTLFLSLDGELTEDSLERQMKPIDATLAASKLTHRLLIDANAMTGYTSEARGAFVDWHRTNKGRLGRVAIVTERMLWHMVIRAMAMASGQQMRPFSDRTEAEAWLLAPGHT